MLKIRKKKKNLYFDEEKHTKNQRKRDKNTTCKTGIICESKNMRAHKKNTSFSLTRSFIWSYSFPLSFSLICECFDSILSHICATIFIWVCKKTIIFMSPALIRNQINVFRCFVRSLARVKNYEPNMTIFYCVTSNSFQF